MSYPFAILLEMVCEDVVDKTADRQVPLAEKPDKSGDFAVQRPVDIDTLPFVAGARYKKTCRVVVARKVQGAFAARQRVLRSLRREGAVCCGIRTRSCHEAAQVLFVEPLIRFVLHPSGRDSVRGTVHSSGLQGRTPGPAPHREAAASNGLPKCRAPGRGPAPHGRECGCAAAAGDARSIDVVQTVALAAVHQVPEQKDAPQARGARGDKAVVERRGEVQGALQHHAVRLERHDQIIQGSQRRKDAFRAHCPRQVKQYRLTAFLPPGSILFPFPECRLRAGRKDRVRLPVQTAELRLQPLPHECRGLG